VKRLGRKNTVLISMIFILTAMIIPLIAYKFPVLLIAFALLGIGNTILQVSLNPLLTNVVRGDRLSSSLTLGQFIKAIASLLGPIIAGMAESFPGSWKYIFPVFGYADCTGSYGAHVCISKPGEYFNIVAALIVSFTSNMTIN
jgi:MFS transporter, FHS family, L-fucose permease